MGCFKYLDTARISSSLDKNCTFENGFNIQTGTTLKFKLIFYLFILKKIKIFYGRENFLPSSLLVSECNLGKIYIYILRTEKQSF